MTRHRPKAGEPSPQTAQDHAPGSTAPGEFDLIRRYFDRPVRRAVLGVGDDCALLALAPGMQLAVSTDMLVEGRHFLSTVEPRRLGHKALAVNLSDLAACGARPLAFTLALSLPRADEAFVAGLAEGLFALAQAHDIELVGGDTTAGPLNLCITVMGEVPVGQALLRSGVGAQVELHRLPHSQVLAGQPPALRQECLLAGGDDYELLFCAPPARHAAVLQAAAAAQVPVQCIGRITAEPGLRVLDEAGRPLDLSRLQAFDHFKS